MLEKTCSSSQLYQHKARLSRSQIRKILGPDGCINCPTTEKQRDSDRKVWTDVNQQFLFA